MRGCTAAAVRAPFFMKSIDQVEATGGVSWNYSTCYRTNESFVQQQLEKQHLIQSHFI